MKLLYNIFLLVNLSFLCIGQQVTEYHAMMQPYVQLWQEESMGNLSIQELITITDVLLLSYQVAQASCMMALEKLRIQTELFTIVTLAIHDSFDASLQAQNNDFTHIKQSIHTIEQAQEQIKFACNTLKSFGPLLIHCNPAPIQLFIANFKQLIVEWAKSQQITLDELGSLQENFVTTAHYYERLKNIFEEVHTSPIPEQGQLVDGANTLHEFYDNIEQMIAKLTATRHQSTLNFHALLTLYFKRHYQLLYDYIQHHVIIDTETIDVHSYTIMATQNHQLPDPETFFAIS